MIRTVNLKNATVAVEHISAVLCYKFKVCILVDKDQITIFEHDYYEVVEEAYRVFRDAIFYTNEVVIDVESMGKCIVERCVWHCKE